MAVQRIVPAAVREAANAGGQRRPVSARRIRSDILAAADDQSSPELQSGLDRRAEVLATARFNAQDPERLVAEIANLWEQAQERFLAIGQCLINARELIEAKLRTHPVDMTPGERRGFSETEWRKFIERLPFSQGIASQLERVAKALNAGRLTRAELPPNYSVAYQLTTLNDAELEAARRSKGIIGPSATRARIIQFKRNLRQARLDRRDEIQQRRNAIMANLERLQAELATLDQELADLVDGQA
jgi:hypothetical protein